MKIQDIMLILVLLVVLIPSELPTIPNPSTITSKYELMANEGMVAIHVASYMKNLDQGTPVPKPKNHSAKDCQCGGTGKLKTDGRISLPCPCEVCGCKKAGGSLPTQELTQVKQKTQILFLTGADGQCYPCDWNKGKVFPYMRESGWKIDKNLDSHILMVDQATHPEYNVEGLPTFIVMRDGVEVERFGSFEPDRTGTKNRDAMVNKLVSYFR
jgi:hypothetical protein